MDKKQLKELIEKVLKKLDLHSEDATNLILGTIAQESGLGKFIKQLKGPALGVCQMEPFTFNDHINNYLAYNPVLKAKIREVSNCFELKSESLEYNLALSIAMCRVHYLRVDEALPKDLPGYAKYWKKYYNTIKGKGTEIEFINNYKKYVQ